MQLSDFKQHYFLQQFRSPCSTALRKCTFITAPPFAPVLLTVSGTNIQQQAHLTTHLPEDISVYLCESTRVHRGRWSLLVYHVHIIIVQETLSCFPVSHTTIFETFKIHTLFPNMTAGLVWFLNAVWWSQIKRISQTKKRILQWHRSWQEHEGASQETAKQLTNNLQVQKESKIPRGIACLHIALS